MANNLAPLKIGMLERKTIIDALISDENQNRANVISFLISDEGQKLWRNLKSEKNFHKALCKKVPSELKHLLDTIRSYEKFARILQNAFDTSLYKMSKSRDVYIKNLVDLEEIQIARKELPELFEIVLERLNDYNDSLHFENTFGAFNESTNSSNWVEILISHHQQIQKKKPPNGKRPWFEKTDDGRVLIYPNYRRNESPDSSNEYVHYYRTYPLWSFMKDLKKVSDE